MSWKFIVLVLCVDDIHLEISNINMSHDTNRFLSSNFNAKDINDASYVLGNEIY
jgi:hypothetical protein